MLSLGMQDNLAACTRNALLESRYGLELVAMKHEIAMQGVVCVILARNEGHA